jgi:hypothetical protein
MNGQETLSKKHAEHENVDVGVNHLELDFFAKRPLARHVEMKIRVLVVEGCRQGLLRKV